MTIEVKLFEVRDRATFVPVACVMLRGSMTVEDSYLCRRVGYDLIRNNVLYFRLNGDGKALSDPHEWGDRTNQTAHLHILSEWNDLKSGDVVDVEYILGEANSKKITERCG